MYRPRLLRAVLALVVLSPMVLLAGVGPSAGTAAPAAPATAGFRKGADLTAASRASSAKLPTSRLARSDQRLLARSDAGPVQVVVKLDYDPLATYSGHLKGFPATGPATTGRALANSTAEQTYEKHIVHTETEFLKALQDKVPGVQPGRRLRTVYGGLALTAPANRLRDLAKLPGVVAVQEDSPRRTLTDSSTGFIGAGGPAETDGGAGVIVGVLDSGAWPEHPSFAETEASQAPPAKADGTPRACDFGDNPLTEEADPFACNRKLIGGAAFLETYLGDPGRAAEERYHTTRDSDGHGTHTASTAAGTALASAGVLGTERGPVRGIAPGAWLSVYKVCGVQGCYASDSAAAVGQAIRDGVQAINFSISGGTDPMTDPVELAFLDAYAAGVFVAASAGNSGPGAGTTDHLSPWVTTVAASTQRREFTSTLRLRAGTVTGTFAGASITAGVGPAPVVLAESVAGYAKLCGTPAPAGAFAGRIVACERGGGIARVEKGHNVRQGGAIGMILYNPVLQDVETDNHWVPTVHLPDGAAFVAFMKAHPQGVTGDFTAGEKRTGRGDVMAAFSSRGPVGQFIKPDVTAPGVQVLAGHTPTPDSVAGGPAGQQFQAIAGTSMSAPHVAGAAAWLKSRHPDWTPGRIRSALMTTATTAVVKEDLRTPADPFDMGAGRIRVDRAGTVGLVFDETPARMVALTGDPVNAVHLNLPSVNAPVMPGQLTTVRTATNVTGRTLTYRATATTAAGASLTVRPAILVALPGRSVELSITIQSSAPTRQFFGEVRLEPVGGGTDLRLPVAFVPQPGAVTLSSTCTPATVSVGGTSLCTVAAANTTFDDATVDLTTTLDQRLTVTGASGAMIVGDRRVEVRHAALAGARPGTPSLAPGTLFGYVPLDRFDIAPQPLGDEEMLNFDLPAPVGYGGRAYRRVGVTSNGYLVAGGGDAADVQCCRLTRLPDPARPNNVLAPFWTDLDGSAAPGIYAGVLNATDNSAWLVVEWRVNVFGTDSRRTFQVWMRMGGTEEIGFAYPPTALPADPGLPFLIGAENVNGSGGDQLPAGALPTSDLLVRSTDPVPGGSLTYTVTVRGQAVGNGAVQTRLDSPQVPGATLATSRVTVRSRML